MAACVPAGTVALAGANLEQLRTSPLYGKLPLSSFSGAKSLLAAWNGKEVLVISAPGPALNGPPEMVESARGQQKTGISGALELLKQADEFADRSAIWIVLKGDTTLPLAGNAANVNRLMRNMEFAAITAGAGPRVELALTARGRTDDAARHFEETLRAMLTLLAAAETKHPKLAGLLRSIPVRRDGQVVRAGVSTDADGAVHLLELLVP